jgi:hypothetical protein
MNYFFTNSDNYQSHTIDGEYDMLERETGEESITRPIFVVGSGRSGTTLLFRFLSGHPDLAWVSGLSNKFPRWPQLSVFNRLPTPKSKSPTLRRIFALIRPNSEASSVYDYCGISSLFQQKESTLTESDVSDFSRKQLRRIVRTHMKWMGKPRFINKNTANTMRVRYINEIFPDSIFIHIIRDGYAVSNSLNNVNWWPDLQLWWLGKTPREWAEENDGNPLELCAMHWKHQVEQILVNKTWLSPHQYFECRYEDLVGDPSKLLQEILSFCGLGWMGKFESHLINIPVDNRNYKWQDELDDESKDVIRQAAGDLLSKLGY